MRFFLFLKMLPQHNFFVVDLRCIKLYNSVKSNILSLKYQGLHSQVATIQGFENPNIRAILTMIMLTIHNLIDDENDLLYLETIILMLMKICSNYIF